MGSEMVPHNASRSQGYRELPRRPVYVAEHGEPTPAAAMPAGAGASCWLRLGQLAWASWLGMWLLQMRLPSGALQC